ncbi:sodium:proton antiporter [Dysgonomonas sp. 216]|uniref:sodium:proton antiporter NhaD n=1 Tax=Dysgonomonas sp. 216 TaxID=2302934 RepID=UPI0013D6DA76|nr:sodium:proton antiporter NhaD [Dysgonomonas sp. 216]NDW17805.1 sodium:proton antiporter [Dysgonomonas sp. 216]
MFLLMTILFVLGYICIALEHVIHINKSGTALALGATMWVCVALSIPSEMFVFTEFENYLASHPDSTFISWLTHHPLLNHLGETAEILFFLMGAMTIVELIDSHRGFSIITDRIQTTKKRTLLWIICILSFFMSAALDNMTTTIVMVTLIRKLIADRGDKWLFVGMVIVAANAGGAWSPIGDVTTIMLWVAGKVSSLNIIKMTFLASLVSLIVPLVILSFMLKGNIQRPGIQDKIYRSPIPEWQSRLVLFVGVGALLFVPVFKTITHLPPYLGMLGGLGILWVLTDFMHKKNEERRNYNTVAAMLQKIDTSSILFFLGILMAVAGLQTYGHLNMLSMSLESINLPEPDKYYLITIVIGVLSAIVDNVPLVAGAMGMYNFPVDHYFWEFLAYTAGTGGSILIIGSAAGVAAMGMERIDFIWYVKRISWLAFVGYIAGCGVFILQKMIFC